MRIQEASKRISPDPTTKMTTPTTPEQMLVFLRQEARPDDDIEETIFKVKMTQTWTESYKSLNEQSRDKLAKTYAHLMNLEDTSSEEVAKLNKDGLRVMVLHRLQELMPEQCQTCTKTHSYHRTETPMVCCVRCNRGACKDCYQSNPGAGRSFHYLCTNCEKFVSSNIGEKALNANHLLRKPKVAKKKQVQTETMNETAKPAEEATDDAISSSCPFTNDVV